MENHKRKSFVTLTSKTTSKKTTTITPKTAISSTITNKRKSRKAITNTTSFGGLHGINNKKSIKCRRNGMAGLGKFMEFGIIIYIIMTSMLGSEVAAIAKIDHYLERQMLPVLNQIKTDSSLKTMTTNVIPSLETTPTRELQQPTQTSTTLANSNNYINYDDNDFQPIIPKDIPMERITAKVFTENGQYRVFQPDESDLRATAAKENHVRWRLQDTTKWSEIQDATKERKVQGETKSRERQGTTKGYDRPEMEQEQQFQMITNNWSKVKDEKRKMQISTKERVVLAKPISSNKQSRVTTPVRTTTAALKTTTPTTTTSLEINATASAMTPEPKIENKTANETRQTSPSSPSSTTALDQDILLNRDAKDLEDLLLEYIENFFTKGQYEPLPELIVELKKNHSKNSQGQEISGVGNTSSSISHDDSNDDDNDEDLAGSVDGHNRDTREIETMPSLEGTLSSLLSALKQGKDNDEQISRDLQTGRLIFITGLKKIIWPIFMGLQILKSLLFAMFLPTLIGSFGKIVSKGITSASIRPMEAPQGLDFRDHTFNFDEENNKFIINDDAGDKNEAAYQQQLAEATQTHYTNFNGINYEPLSRFGGINEKQLNRMPDSYMNALQSIGAASFKNSGSLSSSSSQAFAQPNFRRKPVSAANTNNFQTFHKVPATSLLLSNYDPFYSPLLSRLDSVFAQLKLNSENEICREKLICLMYANPAKYAPYSNLVSAQLSRELNELRKPTSDNPDILRFFKYMRAAKDGQDGIDCETTFDGCKEFKDYENPAMLSTYHDINKLVQARKHN